LKPYLSTLERKNVSDTPVATPKLTWHDSKVDRSPKLTDASCRNYGYCVRELQALVAPKTPQGLLVRGHAGLVINQLSCRNEGLVKAAEALTLDNARLEVEGVGWTM